MCFVTKATPINNVNGYCYITKLKLFFSLVIQCSEYFNSLGGAGNVNALATIAGIIVLCVGGSNGSTVL